jgi:hypothetical protein
VGSPVSGIGSLLVNQCRRIGDYLGVCD